MDYCKFENTLGALQECRDKWELSKDASSYEKEAKEKLIELCKEIAEEVD